MIEKMRNNLRRSSVPKHLADIFALPLYQKIQPHQLSSHQCVHTYTDNATFWKDAFAKQHFQMMRLQLKRFHLMEWLPSAPGRYFTEAARLSRKKAEVDIDGSLNEYGPLGKSQMIYGGMGSFRLGPQRLDGMNQYFLGATSTGISHEGIPVVLNERDYQDIIPFISQSGGCLTDLEGTLQILQMSPPSTNTPFSLFYDPGTPRYCFVVERMHRYESSPVDCLVATAAIAFSLKNASIPFHKAWAYASFRPGRNSGLDDAVYWLQDYAKRYSGMPHPQILADFDEHYQHFAYPVEFPLRQITEQAFDIPRAMRYQHVYKAKKSGEHVLLKRNHTPLVQNDRKPVRTFLCFAPKDELWAEAFKVRLKALQRKNDIDLHVESEVLAGSERLGKLKRELEQAQLILFLLSADFIADDYYYEEVALRALQLHKQKQAKVVMIYVRPAHYEGLPIEDVQILPENAIPINDQRWNTPENAFHDIMKTLQGTIETMI